MIRAVLGGTFDPFHRGHAAMVGHLLEMGFADLVHVIPAFQSPHKLPCPTPAHRRLAMVRLALAEDPAVAVESLEVDRGQKSYTVDTLQELGNRYPGDTLRLAVGQDQCPAFGSWRSPQKILDLCELIVFARVTGDRSQPSGTDEILTAIANLGLKPGPIHLVRDFDETVSSTEVRDILIEGGDPGDLICEPVARYIARHRLYRS